MKVTKGRENQLAQMLMHLMTTTKLALVMEDNYEVYGHNWVPDIVVKESEGTAQHISKAWCPPETIHRKERAAFLSHQMAQLHGSSHLYESVQHMFCRPQYHYGNTISHLSTMCMRRHMTCRNSTCMLAVGRKRDTILFHFHWYLLSEDPTLEKYVRNTTEILFRKSPSIGNEQQVIID